MPRINKTYTPTELKAAIAVLQGVGIVNPEALVEVLHERGWRVVFAGKLCGERTVRQPRGY